MVRSSIIIKHEYATTLETLIEALALPLNVEVAIRNLECSIQKALGGRNLPHLPARRTHG
jgi:hypothetical protein